MLKQQLTNLKGIGPGRAEMLGAAGLFLCEDLLYFMPRCHEDYSAARPVCALKHGDNVAVRVTIDAEGKLAFVKKRMNILTVHAHDDTGALRLVWYNQPYRKQTIGAGRTVYACGRVDTSHGVKLLNPDLYDELPGILPVYPAIAGLPKKVLRSLIRQAMCFLGELDETVPDEILERCGLVGIRDAIRAIHCPKDQRALAAAQRRLAFEDALRFFVMLRLFERSQNRGTGISFSTEGTLERFLPHFPYLPTAAQRRAMADIQRDMARPTAMNRLIQGDVGAGKTLLALYALFIAVENGYQGVFMAPTEILAAQHYESLKRIFPGKACLVTGSLKKSERDTLMQGIQTGELCAIAGTHALLQGDIAFSRLGVVVTDEQHRFGVRQRALISAKGSAPDVLVMSATPNPRTLALILYGDLDLSLVDELPPGRKPIETRFVPQKKRPDMYRFIDEEVQKGRQAYVVCPLVDQSDRVQAASAAEVYAELCGMLRSSVGLLTGQMSAAQKEKTLSSFRNGEIGVLVSTTVIEVGIDVRNATIMVIEGADRYGLSQLHQLRGRVGRGALQSYCFLLSEGDGAASAKRLHVLTETCDGFVIAQKDLEMRGPGEFLGQHQHGMGMFQAAKLALDIGLLNDAKAAAEEVIRQAALPRSAALIERVRAEAEKLSASVAMN